MLASALPGEADAIAPVLPDIIGEAVLLRAGIDAGAIIRAGFFMAGRADLESG